VDFKTKNAPRVNFLDCAHEEGVLARKPLQLAGSYIGKKVALLFEGGNPVEPLVMRKLLSFVDELKKGQTGNPS